MGDAKIALFKLMKLRFGQAIGRTGESTSASTLPLERAICWSRLSANDLTLQQSMVSTISPQLRGIGQMSDDKGKEEPKENIFIIQRF